MSKRQVPNFSHTMPFNTFDQVANSPFQKEMISVVFIVPTYDDIVCNVVKQFMINYKCNIHQPFVVYQ